jgi:hypothetical protein
MLPAVDIALLLAEIGGGSGVCVGCSRTPLDEVRHSHGCYVDLALAERGFDTSHSRDVARQAINWTTAPTLPPPAPEGK